jgi:hypothetical protein
VTARRIGKAAAKVGATDASKVIEWTYMVEEGGEEALNTIRAAVPPA